MEVNMITAVWKGVSGFESDFQYPRVDYIFYVNAERNHPKKKMLNLNN
jgi:hypothetical protein